MRHRWRLAVTGTTSAAFVAAGLIVSLTGGPARDVVAIERPPDRGADQAPDPRPAPPPRPTAPPPAGATPGDPTVGAARAPSTSAVVVRDAGRWELWASSDGTSSCVELRTSTWSSGPLLCDAEVPDGTVGDLALLPTPAGPAVVAAVDPAVTGVRGVDAGPLGLLGGDPFRPDLRWFVTTDPAAVPSGSPDAGLLVESGEHTVARVLLPTAPGTHRAGTYGVLTRAPYGRWDGYRRAGVQASWLGGLEEVGFHDGATGVRCTLHRRFGGSREEVVAERCPPPSPQLPVADARLLPTGTGDHHLLHAVTDEPATGWRCLAPTGATCEVDGDLVLRDPGGSGRRALVGTSPLRIVGAERVTLVVLGRGGLELGRVGLEVPPG